MKKAMNQHANLDGHSLEYWYWWLLDTKGSDADIGHGSNWPPKKWKINENHKDHYNSLNIKIGRIMEC